MRVKLYRRTPHEQELSQLLSLCGTPDIVASRSCFCRRSFAPVVETTGAGAGTVQRHPRRAQPPHHRRKIAPGTSYRQPKGFEIDESIASNLNFGEHAPHRPILDHFRSQLSGRGPKCLLCRRGELVAMSFGLTGSSGRSRRGSAGRVVSATTKRSFRFVKLFHAGLSPLSDAVPSSLRIPLSNNAPRTALVLRTIRRRTP